MTPTTLVVLVVVPHQGRYLIVEERDGTFYLPAGRVEARENLVDAAARETHEESGAHIVTRGILGFDHDWSPGSMRLRFVFVGDLAQDGPLKKIADEHSRGAAWVKKEDLGAMPLRHSEVLKWIERYESGAPLLPSESYEPANRTPVTTSDR